MCRSATVSSLGAIQHSPSACARFDTRFLAFPQCNLLFNVLMLFGDPQPMIFALIGYTLVMFLSNSISFFVGPVSTKSSPCVKPDTQSSLWWNKILRALKSPVPDVLLPITFPIACRVPRSIHALLQQSYFPSVGAHSVSHW